MKTNKRLWLALVCLFAVFFSVQAQDSKPKQQLVIELKNSTEQVTFVLADKPKITMNGNQLDITDSKKNQRQISLAEVQRYYFKTVQIADGINLTSAKSEQPTLANGHVYYTGLKANSMIMVVALSGQQVARYQASKAGTADVDLTTLPAGIYLVKAGRSTIKIINK